MEKHGDIWNSPKKKDELAWTSDKRRLSKEKTNAIEETNSAWKKGTCGKRRVKGKCSGWLITSDSTENSKLRKDIRKTEKIRYYRN